MKSETPANRSAPGFHSWPTTAGDENPGANQIPIDQLTYTYNSNSNKLLKVVDAITADHKLGDFKDGNSGTGNDYTYDVNGNLTADLNKDISSITFFPTGSSQHGNYGEGETPANRSAPGFHS